MNNVHWTYIFCRLNTCTNLHLNNTTTATHVQRARIFEKLPLPQDKYKPFAAPLSPPFEEHLWNRVAKSGTKILHQGHLAAISAFTIGLKNTLFFALNLSILLHKHIFLTFPSFLDQVYTFAPVCITFSLKKWYIFCPQKYRSDHTQAQTWFFFSVFPNYESSSCFHS